MGYSYNKKWRNENREKYNEWKKEYYKKLSNGNKNNFQRYTLEELRMIERHDMPDRELAEKLGRSVQAIQVQRSKMKKVN